MKSARELGSGIFLIGALVVGLLSPAGAEAAPGDLDPTFSGDGRQRTDFGFGLGEAAATVRQPDGKIIAVGTNFLGDPNPFVLVRYNADGSLDPSFSGDGKQTTDLGGARATGVALQGDGKIVVVGGGAGTGSDFALARYNADGSLDTSFSGDGKQTTDLGGSDAANGVAIQANGKIVAAGVGDAGGASNFAIARYNPDGSLDTTLSGDGKQTTDFAGADAANAVAIQADGKIVAAGGAGQSGAGADFALARYNPNGSLDASFSGDGKQRTDFGGNVDQDVARGVALQGDGKIVAAGGTADSDFGLARYNPNGSLDTSFSGDGKQTTDFGGGERAQGVALQTDGKMVAVGNSGAGDFGLARYNTDGSLDTSFSGDGTQTTDFSGEFGNDQARAVALQPDGKIVAVGTAEGLGVALARYNPNGSLDTSFSGDGKQTTDFAGAQAAHAVAIQADGKIVAVGSGGAGFALARYDADGSLDTSFSGDGKQTTAGFTAANGVAIQTNGKIVEVGIAGALGGFALARYNPDGSLDTSFSGDGRQTTDFSGFDGANGVGIQANGKIVVVGKSGVGFALARYNPNGSLDTSFSGDGKQTTDFGGSDAAHGVAIQADGKIVAVGDAGVGLTLARYNPNGSLDTTFSGDGKQTTAGFGSANGVAIQADGKIVAVGQGGVGSDFGLARFNANGTLDTSFSGDGKQTTNFGGFDGVSGVALQANGKIVAAGIADADGASNFALARYNANGTLDASFSGDGKQATDFGGLDGASGVALQGDGKIVAAGAGRGTDGTLDFALARYLGG